MVPYARLPKPVFSACKPFLTHQSAKKRPLPASPSAHSPSLLPLAQRIRTDIQVAECELESPEREILRSPPCPENSPSPISPCANSLPSPAPLIFTPVKTSCLNCDAEMAPDHQCEDTDNVPVPAYLGSLPLCHYCCHLGSGDYPVHYFMQCMCDDDDCTCKCYCSGALLVHKQHFFPARGLCLLDPPKKWSSMHKFEAPRMLLEFQERS